MYCQQCRRNCQDGNESSCRGLYYYMSLYFLFILRVTDGVTWRLGRKLKYVQETRPQPPRIKEVMCDSDRALRISWDEGMNE